MSRPEPKWIEVRVRVALAMEEAISNQLFELGAEGVTTSEETAPVQGSDDTRKASGSASNDRATTLTVSGFFDEKQRDSVVTQLREYLRSLAEMDPKQPTATMDVLVVK